MSEKVAQPVWFSWRTWEFHKPRGPRQYFHEISAGEALFPLLILFGLNAVDELDRTVFGVLGPNIRDSFDLSNQQFLALVSLTLLGGLLLEIPLVRSVYAAMRVLLGLFAQHKDPALQVVMVTVPGTQWRLLGFVTRADCVDAAKGIAADGQVAVYFPMSYQVGGYTVFLPKEAVTPVDMSREDAMKFILTAGLKTTPPAAPPPGEKRI